MLDRNVGTCGEAQSCRCRGKWCSRRRSAIVSVSGIGRSDGAVGPTGEAIRNGREGWRWVDRRYAAAE